MKEWEIKQIKRAIQSCKNKRTHHYEHTRSKVSNAIRNEEVKIKALEKQIPKKAIDDGTQFAICPECGASVNKDIEQVYNGETSYCICCGQALDWSETDG